MEILSINWNNTLTIVVLGMVLVLMILTVLVLLLTGCERLSRQSKKNKPLFVSPPQAKPPAKEQNTPQKLDFVAVAMALSMCLDEVHDLESLILTFRPQKRNTAWVTHYQYK